MPATRLVWTADLSSNQSSLVRLFPSASPSPLIQNVLINRLGHCAIIHGILWLQHRNSKIKPIPSGPWESISMDFIVKLPFANLRKRFNFRCRRSLYEDGSLHPAQGDDHRERTRWCLPPRDRPTTRPPPRHRFQSRSDFHFLSVEITHQLDI